MYVIYPKNMGNFCINDIHTEAIICVARVVM